MQKLIFCSLSIAGALICFTWSADANVIAQCSTVTYSLKLNPEICNGQFPSSFDRSIQSIAPLQNTELQKLGISLRQLGYLDKAKQVLQQALLKDPSNQQIQLSLANIARAEYLRAAATFENALDTSSRATGIHSSYSAAQDALQQYELLFGSLQQPNEIKAALNWLRLWSELKSDMPMIQNLRSANQPRFFALAERLAKMSVSSTNPEDLEGKINFLETLSSISNLPLELRKHTFEQTESLISLIRSSEKIRSLSRLLGIHALLSESAGNLDQAMSDLNQAHSAALSILAPELSYRWEHKLGQLYVQRHEYELAKTLYADSINSIESIKDGSLSLKQEIQYDYFDKVEPVYREYLALLLADKRPDFNAIIKINDKLQLGEIENYLQCGRLNTTSLLDLTQTQRPDATIYIVRGTDHYEIFLRSKDGSIRNHSVLMSDVDENIKMLRKLLSNSRLKDTSPTILKTQFWILYTSILKPFEQWLPKDGTIVFAVNSKLQNIPWAALYDGRQFLIERLSVALSSGSEIQSPQKLSRKQLRVIAAGISETPQDSSFSNLPRVADELNAIKKLLPNSKILLDSQFTQSNLERQGADFPIVHLASHGSFSSNPSNTYILDSKGKVPLNQIERLVKERSVAPIELLVLSACETAKGDNRATLGIAGTAIKAGARSTLATLWNGDDSKAAEFMNDFYTALKGGNTKAEALRQAQINVIRQKEGKLANWANVILYGSWL